MEKFDAAAYWANHIAHRASCFPEGLERTTRIDMMGAMERDGIMVPEAGAASRAAYRVLEHGGDVFEAEAAALAVIKARNQ